jgi:hypothetical protein
MNSLTSLVPDLYESLDIVSRELVGFIPAVTLDAQAERAALNQAIRIPVTAAQTAEDVTPGQLPPDDGDQTVNNTVLTISKSRMVPFRWTGEEQKGINTGAGYRNIRVDQIAQAIRTLVNEVESSMAGLAYTASRASGLAGTTPFQIDLSDTAKVRKILADNGAPLSDMQLVIDTTAGAKVRSLGILTKANEAGTTELRAQGKLLDIHGFQLRESAGIQQVSTLGTGTGYELNGSHAKGATVINVNAGTGTIIKGDLVTVDGHIYPVATSLSGGSFTINAPGLAISAADGAAVELDTNAYTPNFAFSRSALVLATRAPALPEEGDMADDRLVITDPLSGLSFEFSMYKQYRRVRYEVAMAWGYANIKSAHSSLLLG